MLFNGKFYNKPGHLGMTRAGLLEKLNGGGGGGGGDEYSVSEKVGYSGSYSIVYNSDTSSYQDTISMSEDMIEWVEKNTSPGTVPSYLYIEVSIDGQSQLFSVRPSFESFTIEIEVDDSFLNIIYDKSVDTDKLTLDFTEEKSGSITVKFFDVNVSDDFAKAVNTAITSIIS